MNPGRGDCRGFLAEGRWGLGEIAGSGDGRIASGAVGLWSARQKTTAWTLPAPIVDVRAGGFLREVAPLFKLGDLVGALRRGGLEFAQASGDGIVFLDDRHQSPVPWHQDCCSGESIGAGVGQQDTDFGTPGHGNWMADGARRGHGYGTAVGGAAGRWIRQRLLGWGSRRKRGC